MPTTNPHTARLEELRAELRAERISYGELAELQSLAAHIEPGDVELLEAAGVPEFEELEPPCTDQGEELAGPEEPVQRDETGLEPLTPQGIAEAIFAGAERTKTDLPSALDLTDEVFEALERLSRPA